jgi:hypothetical protein
MPTSLPITSFSGPSAGGTVEIPLNNTSPTAVTNLVSLPCRLYSITNAGPQLTVFPTFFNDAAAVGAAATAVFGDGSTIVLGPGQIYSWDGGLPLVGLAYSLSGALSAGQNLTIVVGAR